MKSLMLNSSSLLIFLFVTLFAVSLSVLLFELTLTRIFSIVLWYDYAFMAISVAFFGLGIGALVIHILKNKMSQGDLPSKIVQSTIAFAVSVPIFLFVIGHIIPSNTTFIYLFYLASSIPFFFAGMSMALVYLTMPREISKLYFIDLAGASAATLVLDLLMRELGAESVLLLTGLLAIGSAFISALILTRKKKVSAIAIKKNIKVCAFIVVAASAALLVVNTTNFNFLAISPGETKGLHFQLKDPSIEHLLTQWNSFSRIDVTRNKMDQSTLANILIDADAATPIFRWNDIGSGTLNAQQLKQYMDYLPYEMSNSTNNNNNALVIGSGGGEDILFALAGGAKNVTAVELNPLIISAAKRFGGSAAGNLYDRKDVHLFIDDGRRFISSTNSKYDKIVIKLVDSWAAQLAGGYALSENYLYTVEGFRQYLQHLNGDNGMLVMVRWNIELPRLMPLVVESLRQEETEKSIQNISKQIMVVEDQPWLLGSSPNPVYPVLIMVKNSPFTDSQLNLARNRIAMHHAKVIAMPDGYIEPPYDKLLLDSGEASLKLLGMNPPTDDSPFYFAREPIPSQMVLLLETVLGVSAALALLLIYYLRKNRRINSVTSLSSRFHIIFVIFIGLGFIFLEITFIQKFLLLLGTPIMALTVILFSVLLSSGIGAYLSGKLFKENPFKAIIISIPLLAALMLIYYYYLPILISSSIILDLYQRIGITFALLSPAGLLMGFQFPSIIKLASYTHARHGLDRWLSKEGQSIDNDITLLWGVNVIASVIGTVLAAISSMVIGFGGNLLIGLGLYLGALGSAIVSVKAKDVISDKKAIVK